MQESIRRGVIHWISVVFVIVTIICMIPGTAMTQTMSQDAKMKWFREAKFGLFIHWGLYCIPAGEWKGQPIAGIGEWIMNHAKIPVKEYEQLATAIQSSEIQRGRLGEDSRGRRDEIHRHHQQAPRRLRNVSLEGEQLQHCGCHPL